MLDFIDFFNKGGTVMWLLVFLSTYVVAVILLKSYQFFKTGLFSGKLPELLMDYVDAGQFGRAYQLAGRHPHPVAKVVAAIFEHSTASGQDPEQTELWQREVSLLGSRELRRLEAYNRSLELIAHLAPLLGLLGTVIGMVAAFSGLEASGRQVDPALLAGGIWQALLTTAAGLAVAIPALAVHSLLDSALERAKAAMQEAAEKLSITLASKEGTAIAAHVLEEMNIEMTAANDEYGNTAEAKSGTF